jgi:hypothetical protein
MSRRGVWGLLLWFRTLRRLDQPTKLPMSYEPSNDIDTGATARRLRALSADAPLNLLLAALHAMLQVE